MRTWRRSRSPRSTSWCTTSCLRSWTAGLSSPSSQSPSSLLRYVCTYVCMCRVQKITGSHAPMHWPFSVHFSKLADQNLKQDTFKYTSGQSNSCRHDKVADQFRYPVLYSDVHMHVWGYRLDMHVCTCTCVCVHQYSNYCKICPPMNSIQFCTISVCLKNRTSHKCQNCTIVLLVECRFS